MSWQSYVDQNLLGTGKIARAAILGQQGGVWAHSNGYELSTEEQRAVIDAYNDPGHVMSSGLKLAGTKFFCPSANKRSIQLKKGADGAVLVKTKQAILVAEYAAPAQGPEAIMVVESVADYLINMDI
ncbi:profilin [Aspergillus tamarii]|uniref:Profilin n=1 Tax=Aspergillus tamarii TaxID=41984 RepID=A0A5N6UFA0_ASPTM|nr:profilin [Aspergillus tamarii]